MTKENKEMLLSLIQQHKELGISEQIDYKKFYLYSIITHSTAIEGSTVTELEAQLLFDEGITSQKRTLVEQLMNLDLKTAYDYGMKWIKHHILFGANSSIVCMFCHYRQPKGEWKPIQNVPKSLVHR